MIKNHFSYFSTKTYVVGSQKNRLNEMILLSTQNILLDLLVRKQLQSSAQIFCMLMLRYDGNPDYFFFFKDVQLHEMYTL